MAWSAERLAGAPLSEFGYGDVSIASDAHESQLMNTHSVLMALDEDSLLKPFRQMFCSASIICKGTGRSAPIELWL